jgi:tRNA-(ms[2]io[6]A)-hydroxylase
MMLGLKVPTDTAWADAAARDLGPVLVDHAHCEMKAASNALSLAARHPHSIGIVRALADLAREEIDHFQRVCVFLERRGLALGPPPVDPYVAELRRAASELPTSTLPSAALVDRLLVGALIEARSCERFKLLMPKIDDRELHVFYGELFAAEARHHRTLVDLAITATGGDEAGVLARLERWSEVEGRIVQALATSSVRRGAIHG